MSKLDEIATRHRAVLGLDGLPGCAHCIEPNWPCEVALLLPIALAAVEYVDADRDEEES